MSEPTGLPERQGPLAGLRVVELGSIGPGPLCAMMLADQGADVVRVDRPGSGVLLGPNDDPTRELLNRNRRSIALDLKRPEDLATLFELIDRADVLLEGFRPGVCERLGFGPDDCLRRNPGLVYGRMTGWGQNGPKAQSVGHDLNYIATNGVLGLIGRSGQIPTPPLNIVGDGGGGGAMLAFGVLAAVYERQSSGRGQVVDAAMVDGSALLATQIFGYLQIDGAWHSERGTNLLDGGAPFYDCYETADGRWMSVGALEPAFYRDLLTLLEIDEVGWPEQYDESQWPRVRDRFMAEFGKRDRDDWTDRAGHLNACVEPMIEFGEVMTDPHLSARRTFVEFDGMVQPAPAPRFARTPGAIVRRPPIPGQDTDEILRDWAISVPESGVAVRDRLPAEKVENDQ